MPDQNSITLEKLLGQLAKYQNTKTMRETLANLEQLTTANLERVLRSLLDPGSFYIDYFPNIDDFEEGLRKEYQRLRKNKKAWKAYWKQLNNSSIVEPKELQGALGLICFTIQLLKISGYRDQALSTSTREQLQDLLNDFTVQNWFYKIYEPTMLVDDTTDQISPTPGKENPKAEENLRLAKEYWQELNLKDPLDPDNPDPLVLYRVGTTSFILRCRINTLAGEKLVLKCLLFPYTQIRPIVKATRDYAKTYLPGKVPMTAKVRSSNDKWILMDFKEGPTLRELLDKRREEERSTPPLLRTDLLASIGEPLLKALSSLPPEIQHEDLTPSNIIVSKNEDGSQRIVLIDLGRNYVHLHKIWLPDNREALFIAPEVRDDNSSSDKTDLYSFGMILIDLVDPQGVQSIMIPDSLYQYAPTLARFVEDLIDVNPNNRLLIFNKKDLLSTFADELKVLPSDPEVKPGMHLRLWGRQIEIKPEVHLWVQQIRDLFYPSSQLALLRELWRLDQSPKHTEIARYSGRLYRWLIFCTIHWNLIFAICFLWGLRDFGVDAFPTFVNIARALIHNCGNCIPGIDSLQQQGHYIRNIMLNLPARLAIFSVMAQTKYYQNILAKLTVKQMRNRLARVTEVTLRGSAICSLVPILIANLYQPRLWLIMLSVGYATVCLNNFLCYRLAIRTLKSARKERLSTVSRSDDPVLEAFGSWGPTMAAYMVLMIALWIGLQIGFLRDEWLYVIATVGVSVIILLISRCIKFAPSLRGSLSRAFIAGERLGAIQDRKA